MTLPHYNMPPLTPHKPKPQDAPAFNMGNQKPMVSAWQRERSRQANLTHVNCSNQPTPTIPQMEDRHARQAFADAAMGWLHLITAVSCGVVMAVFVFALIYRATVGVY